MRRATRVAVGAGLLVVGVIGAVYLFLVPVGEAPAPPPGQALGPTVESPSELRFLAVGDMGVSNERADKVAAGAGEWCRQNGCDMAVFLGDNLYPGGMETDDDPEMDRVFAPWLALNLPSYLVLGNHDYDNKLDRVRAARQISWANRTKHVEFPAPRYTFSAGPADFFALDTMEIFWNGGESHEPWLGEALEKSTAPWRIALGHHPYRSNGTHGNAGNYEGTAVVPYLSGGQLRDFFERSICGAVDLYLSGHEHNLQWLEACGTQFVISGAGAKVTPHVDRGNATRFEAYRPGLVWFHLTERTARLVFLGAEGQSLYDGTFERRAP